MNHMKSAAGPQNDPSQDLDRIIRRNAPRPFFKWLRRLVFLALLAWGGWWGIQRWNKPAEGRSFETELAGKGGISVVVTAAGSLAPTNEVVIGSELSGTIVEVLVDTNDPVTKEQPLARLDPSKLNQQTERSRAALLVARAKVGQAEATLAEDRAALARQEELHRLSGGRTPSRATMENSRASVSRSEADLASARAAVVGAEAEVRAFERDLEKCVIRSPVDGVVLARMAETGQTVAASFNSPNLFTIAEDLRKMELKVKVTEADIGKVAVGQAARFTVDAWPQRVYEGKVAKVAFGADGTGEEKQGGGGGGGGGGQGGGGSSGVVTYSAEIEVANDDLSLRPGMTATVDISIIEREGILVVPNTALRFDPAAVEDALKPRPGNSSLVDSLGSGRRWRSMMGGGSSLREIGSRVWTLRDGQPSEISIKTGVTDGYVTEITGGDLKEGTAVIVSVKPEVKDE